MASSGCMIEVCVPGCGHFPSLESWVVKVEVFWFGRVDFWIYDRAACGWDMRS